MEEHEQCQQIIDRIRQLEEIHCQKYGLKLQQGETLLENLSADLSTYELKYMQNMSFINELIEIMKRSLITPEEDTSSSFQQLRTEYLDFLEKFPWLIDLKPHALEFVALLERIIASGCTKDMIKAVKIVYNFTKQFKRTVFQFANYHTFLK